MSAKDKSPKTAKHGRNLAVIALACLLAYLGWNIFGATQCLMRSGDIEISGKGVLCIQDYSNL